MNKHHAISVVHILQSAYAGFSITNITNDIPRDIFPLVLICALLRFNHTEGVKSYYYKSQKARMSQFGEKFREEQSRKGGKKGDSFYS